MQTTYDKLMRRLVSLEEILGQGAKPKCVIEVEAEINKMRVR